MQDEPAGVAGESGGDVQQPVAQPLGLAAGELAVSEQQPLRPAEQVLADQDELEPGGVGLEVAEGEVAQARLLGAADRGPRGGAGAVQLLEAGDPAPCWLVRKTWKR